jgi:two-component system chemotaxis response regulator CheY
MELKQKVLVVDDEPCMRKFLRTLLEVDGFDVEAVNSGKEAVTKVNNGERPDFILLNVLMPEMNGLDTLQELMRLDQSLNVIMESCSDEFGTVAEAIRLGARDYLVIPFEKAELDEAMLIATQRKPRRDFRDALYARCAMATDFNSLDDNGGPVPPVNSTDLRTLWATMEGFEKKLKERIPGYKRGHAMYAPPVNLYRSFSPRANVGAIVHRWSMLGLLNRMSKVGGPTLPGMKDGEPTDALFKAFAVVPMTGPGRDDCRGGFPCDWDELVRLVKMESDT